MLKWVTPHCSLGWMTPHLAPGQRYHLSPRQRMAGRVRQVEDVAHAKPASRGGSASAQPARVSRKFLSQVTQIFLSYCMGIHYGCEVARRMPWEYQKERCMCSRTPGMLQDFGNVRTPHRTQEQHGGGHHSARQSDRAVRTAARGTT